MTLPGGGLRLQTLGRLATQLFDSTLRTTLWMHGDTVFLNYIKYVLLSGGRNNTHGPSLRLMNKAALANAQVI